MENFIGFQEIIDKEEKEKILTWSIASIFFKSDIKEKGNKIVIDGRSANVIEKIKEALIEGVKIEIITVRKRACVISRGNILVSPLGEEQNELKVERPFYLFVNEGNLFEVTVEELKNGTLRIEDLEGKIIPRIFSEGDLIYSHAPFSSIFGIKLMGVERVDKKPHGFKEIGKEEMGVMPRCIVSGLPWESGDNIHPVSLIKLTPTVDIFDLYKKDAFLGSWIGLLYGHLLEEEFNLSQLRLWTQLTNRAEAKVAFILYNCFKGEMPVQWWKNLQGKELGEKDVDKIPHLLKKPRETTTAFAIEGKQLALLSGVTEKGMEDLLIWSDKKQRNRFLENSKILSEFLGLTIKEGVYFFSIREPSQKLNPQLLYKIHSNLLQELRRYAFP